MKFFRLSSAIVFTIILSSFAFAQQREPGPMREQPQVFIEPVNRISDDPAKSRLDILYRIPYEFFIFTQNSDPKAASAFRAKAEITVELFDQTKTSVAREFLTKEIGSEKPLDISSPKQFLEGVISFNSAPGEYSILFEARDVESDRKYTDKSKTVHLKKFDADSLTVSDIVFLNSPIRTNPEPLNFAGDVPFGTNFLGYTELCSDSPADSLRASYRIYRIAPENKAQTMVVEDTILQNEISDSKSIIADTQGHAFSYRIDDTKQHSKRTVWMNVRGDTLPQAAYNMEITIHKGNQTVRFNKQFNIRWIGMPLSLRLLRNAIDALEYITTGDELKEMQRASGKQQREAFEQFWKKRDKTPNTAFNEIEAEYYKRVDYAFANFGTVKEPNGIKSERGKAYILYGPPTNTSREFSPASDPKEIWTYSNLSKRLTFIDVSRTGEYKLIKSEKL